MQTCYLGAVKFFFFLVFLGPHLWHVEVPKLGVESELQLPAYTTAHSNAGSSWILRKATDQTRILMDTSQVC